MIAQSLLVDVSINTVDNQARANMYLAEHDFEEALADRNLDPAVAFQVLALKSHELRNYAGTLMPVKDFDEMVNGKNRQRLKDLFRKEVKEKYSGIDYYLGKPEWTLTAGEIFYGESIRSAVYKSAGKGNAYIEWKAEIPEDGFYEVSIWNAKNERYTIINEQGQQSGPESIQTYTLTYEGESESVTLDLEEKESGWIPLGNFYLSRGEATIRLTDKAEGKVVIADAVRFKLAK